MKIDKVFSFTHIKHEEFKWMDNNKLNEIRCCGR